MGNDKFLSALVGVCILAVIFIRVAIIAGVVLLCIYGIHKLIKYIKRRKTEKSFNEITSELPDDIYIAPEVITEVAESKSVVNKAVLISPSLKRLEAQGISVKIADSSISLECPDGVDIKEVLICAEQINMTLASNSYIIFLYILDKERNRLVDCSIYSNEGREHIWFTASISFADKINKEKDKKFEFYSDCVDYISAMIFCHFKNKEINQILNIWETILQKTHYKEIDSTKFTLEERIKLILEQSDYGELFSKKILVHTEGNCVVINYDLPSRDNFMSVKEYKQNLTTNEITKKSFSNAFITKLYEQVLYSICLRSIAEILHTSSNDEIETVAFNGFVTAINRSSGKSERKCIISILTNRNTFEEIDLLKVDPKLCFKSLKGVSAAKLIDITPVIPVLTFDENDKRFIEGRHTPISSGTNLAEMDWNDFEQLVRELFELEFASRGGKVKVTQASRDGGVDAIAFDPDPIHGGKIVIQAKRYTHTVSVSAVRDLYGTVINEGANSGILITTADYGSDSFEFAKNKPIKLLNGGHLLAMLHKHGKSAHIDIAKARNNAKVNYD